MNSCCSYQRVINQRWAKLRRVFLKKKAASAKPPELALAENLALRVSYN